MAIKEYQKIQTVFKRCMDSGPDKNKLIEGDWTLPEFETLQSMKWEATEKIDGMNIRIDWDGANMTIDGRNENAMIPASLVNWLMVNFPPGIFRMQDLPPMTIYGEGFGDGIKKGGDYINGSVSFAGFDIFCNGFWLERHNVVDILGRLRIRTVPLLRSPTIAEAIELVSKGFDSQYGTAKAEGVVLRAPHGMLLRNGKRIITKIKTRDFLKGTIPKKDGDCE